MKLTDRIQNECRIRIKQVIQEWTGDRGTIGIYQADDGIDRQGYLVVAETNGQLWTILIDSETPLDANQTMSLLVQLMRLSAQAFNAQQVGKHYLLDYEINGIRAREA